jgi:hypothetical protein
MTPRIIATAADCAESRGRWRMRQKIRPAGRATPRCFFGKFFVEFNRASLQACSHAEHAVVG